MTLSPRLAAAGAICALAAAGCGVGAGDDAGEVDLTVTRDYGAEELIHEDESISESDTAMRVLDRSAEIETRYGGGFVRSIDGLAGGTSGGRRSDWFFYVNGIESPIGAADFELADGDRVWWDHRDWTAAMRVPAVVGSWPEPFVRGFRGERWGTEIDCRAAGPVCARVGDELSAEGAAVREPGPGEDPPVASEDSIRVLVGEWNRIGSDPDAQLIARGPAASGVFALLTGSGDPVLTLLNAQGEPAGTIGRASGLIAAVRPDDGPPTWVVTGTDPKGVAIAAHLTERRLDGRYAVVVEEGIEPIGVPVP